MGAAPPQMGESMLEILHYIFSDFYRWFGMLIYLGVIFIVPFDRIAAAVIARARANRNCCECRKSKPEK